MLRNSTTRILVPLAAIALICAAYDIAASVKPSPELVRAPVTPVETAANPGYAASAKGQTTNLKLIKGKNYGDRYASADLPVGDGHYVTSGAKKGYVYVCNTQMFVPAGQAGAQTRGPWFSADGTTYDPDAKVHVAGSVNWKQQLSLKLSGGKRVIDTNDLPAHPTGVFPVQQSDPASQYDRNPNSIASQHLVYRVSAKPKVASHPYCMGGESGVMTTGVALFNGFDAGGRDAGAWEVQDSCSGHPQRTGEYHYHTLSACIANVGVTKVIGYALDGFPITGPRIAGGNILTTRNLDACHGITSTIKIGGKRVTMFHYVMTEDFPYSVSCFRAKPIRPPGQGG